MNPKVNAVRTGIHRGWTEFMQSLRSPQDQGFYLFMALVILGYLWFNRNNEMDGTTLSYAAVAMPSILGATIAFGMIVGPAYALAMEREDGTLLRAKAAPDGVLGHVVGHVVSNTMGVIPSYLVILIPSAFLFPGFMANGAAGWFTVLWVTVLGITATLPIGIIFGSIVPSVQKVGLWVMLPFGVLSAISGIFFPIQSLWGWVQVVAQMFPIYWLGLGMRQAFLPDAAAVLEIGESWRTGWVLLVLVLWTLAGVMLAPPVLRRMARRQSGSAVEAAREAAAQWVR